MRNIVLGIVMDMSRPGTSIHLLARLVLCTVLSGCTTPDFGNSEAGLALEDLASGLASSRLAGQAPRPSRGQGRRLGGKPGPTGAAELNPPPLEKTDRPLSGLLWLKLWGLP